MRAGEPERVTQEVDQEKTGLDLGRLLGAVDRHRDTDRACHRAVSSSSTVGTCSAAYWAAGGVPTAVRFCGPGESFVPSGQLRARVPFSSSGGAPLARPRARGVLPVASMNALDDVQRQREHDRRVLRRADLGQRLQVAQLQRGGVAADHVGGVAQLLGGLELALGVDDLRAPLALGLGLQRHRALHRARDLDVADLDRRDLDAPRLGVLVDGLLDRLVELLALGQQRVELGLAEHRAQRRLRDLRRRLQEALDLDRRARRVDHAEVADRVDLGRHVVARDDGSAAGCRARSCAGRRGPCGRSPGSAAPGPAPSGRSAGRAGTRPRARTRAGRGSTRRPAAPTMTSRVTSRTSIAVITARPPIPRRGGPRASGRGRARPRRARPRAARAPRRRRGGPSAARARARRRRRPRPRARHAWRTTPMRPIRPSDPPRTFWRRTASDLRVATTSSPPRTTATGIATASAATRAAARLADREHGGEHQREDARGAEHAERRHVRLCHQQSGAGQDQRDDQGRPCLRSRDPTPAPSRPSETRRVGPRSGSGGSQPEARRRARAGSRAARARRSCGSRAGRSACRCRCASRRRTGHRRRAGSALRASGPKRSGRNACGGSQTSGSRCDAHEE